MFVKRGLSVLALSETKMRGKGDVEFGRVCGRRSGVEDGRAREGVVLLLSEEFKKCVMEWGEVSVRLMWVKLRLGRQRWVFVSAYGPGSEHEERVREEFWNELNGCLESFGANVNVVVLGDLNARVGDEQVEGVVGKYGIPGRNESGEHLSVLCVERELVVGNTWFRKKGIHKYTYVREAHGVVIDRAVMDYVLVSRSVRASLLDVNVLRGEAGGMSDHYLVEAKMRFDVRVSRGRMRGGAREVVKVSELNKREKEREYQERLQMEWNRVKDGERVGVEEEWAMFNGSVMKCAREVCGMRRVGGGRRKGSEWWNDEVSEAVAAKRGAYEEWLQRESEERYERYKDKRREVKRVVKKAKREADVRWGRQMEGNFEENRKMFWKEVKRLKNGESGREEVVKGMDGQLLVEEGAVRNRWAEYFEGLLNVEDGREAEIVAVPGNGRMPRLENSNVADITKEEVEGALSGMKAGKAPGLDGCAPECVKKGGGALVEWLVRLLNVCFVAAMVPLDWRSACVVPLYKGKGDKHECNSYRGISLLSVVGKLYGIVLIRRVREGTERAIGEEQCGFRRGRGCVDQIFAVRQVCEKFLEKGKDVCWAFMDLEKAYDRIDRDAMWKILRIYGVGGRLLVAIQSFYVNSRACVRVGSSESDWFGVVVGLRQGCVMSSWLFNMFMDGVVREVNARTRGGLELKMDGGQVLRVKQLLFADDTALVEETEEKLQVLVREFGRACDRRKLRVNVVKSKVLRCTRSGGVGRLNVRLNGEMLEEVDSFKYLGSLIEADGGVIMEVKQRVNEAGRVLGGMKRVWNSRYLGMKAKRLLYEGVVVPTALYAAETWGLRAAERRRLDVMEMRCLRSMCGVSRMDRLRNEEVRRRTGVMGELAGRAERSALRWFGHMERMGEERLVKKVMNAEAGGRGARGRPPYRWRDGVKSGLAKRGMTVDQGRLSARDRDVWRAIVRS